tara:strand:- start:78 stop:806 length:729 start_codon:yes stop_codon:yes gene_type:complete
MKIDIIYSYYNQPELLDTYLKHWNSNISHEIRKNINFIIVDDNSTYKASDVLKDNTNNCNLQCFYINEDRGFNLAGSRNLGAEKSKTENILILDFDLVIYEDLIKEILSWELHEDMCYRFKQTTVKGFDFERNIFKYKTLNSPMYLKRSLYIKAGGTDEDFAGNYGYEDVYLRGYLKQALNIKFKYINKNKIYQIPTGKSKNVDRNNGPAINKEILTEKIKTYPKPNNNIRFKYELEYENFI